MNKNTARELLVKALDDMEAKALEMKIRYIPMSIEGGLSVERYF